MNERFTSYEICAVIDTNVFLSIFRYPDNITNNHFWQHILSGGIVPIYSIATLSENCNKLLEHGVPDILVDEFADVMIDNGIYIEDLTKMRVLMKDFKDIPFYEVSLAVNKITGTDVLLATRNAVDFREYGTQKKLPEIEIKTEREICAALEEAIKFARRAGVENHDGYNLLLAAAKEINKCDIKDILYDKTGRFKKEALLTQEEYECHCIRSFFAADINGYEFAVSEDTSEVIRQVIRDQKQIESGISTNSPVFETQKRIRSDIESLLSEPTAVRDENTFLAFSERLKAICHIMGGDLSDYIDDIGNRFFGIMVALPASADVGTDSKSRKASFMVDCSIEGCRGKWQVSIPYRFASSDYDNGTINVVYPSYKEIRLKGIGVENNNKSVRMTFKEFSECIVKKDAREDLTETNVTLSQDGDALDSDDFFGLGG